MSNFGFVYMLSNPYMSVVKIGCTERSPHARAEELSKPTGVPAPFDVVCYIEVPDFQSVERKFHQWLAHRRVNDCREFFDCPNRSWLVGLFQHYPNALSYSDVSVATFIEPEEIWNIPDPFHKDPPPEAEEKAIAAIDAIEAAEGSAGE